MERFDSFDPRNFTKFIKFIEITPIFWSTFSPLNDKIWNSRALDELQIALNAGVVRAKLTKLCYYVFCQRETIFTPSPVMG